MKTITTLNIKCELLLLVKSLTKNFMDEKKNVEK